MPLHSAKRARVEEALLRLEAWIAKNGWAGYDPYDLKEYPIYQRWTKPPLSKWGEIVIGLENTFPLTLRRLFRIPKKINAKGIGILAGAYLYRYQATGEEKYLQKTRACLDWLYAHPSPGYKEFCWGYPFVWHSAEVLPRFTPSGHVSAVCGDAFFRYYKLFGEEKYLDVCRSICRFFLHHLQRVIDTPQMLAVSYTPLDDRVVYNANLWVAEFLLRVGKTAQEPEYTSFADRIIKFVLSRQNPDGSFYYMDPKDSGFASIDNYHTGYVLRLLCRIWEQTGKEYLKQALEGCLKHYLENLFGPQGEPWFTPSYIAPHVWNDINIHSCAEAIICLTKLLEHFPYVQPRLEQTLRWTLDNMQDPADGHFYYMRRINRFGWPCVLKIPMFRWGQAWMLMALAYYHFKTQAPSP